MSGFNRLIKNSIANIINGFSNVILGIVIAPFLVSILSENDFSVWSLNLQFGLFLGLFGVCIQVTVGRFVSEYLATGRKDIIDTLFSSSMLLSIGFFALFLLLIFAFMNNYSSFVQAGDAKKFESYIYSFLLINLSFLFSMLISSLNGYFIGVERNDIIAIVNLCSRILLGICVVLTAQFGVVVMSICFLCVNLLSFVAIYILFRRKESFKIKIRATPVFGKIFESVSGLAVWNVAQFLISGIGAFVIAKYQPDELAAYILCMTLINAVTGILGAVLSPIIQPIVRFNSSMRFEEGNRFVVRLCMLFSLIVLCGQLISYLLSGYLINLWVGPEQLSKMSPLFPLLLVAFTIRMVVAPYGMKLIAESKQLSYSHYPLTEGVLNFLIAIYCVKTFGAVGIAYSTVTSCLIVNVLYAVKFHTLLYSFNDRVSIVFSFIILPLISVFLVYFFSGEIYFHYGFGLFVLLFVLVLLSFFIFLTVKKLKYATNAI